MITYGPSFGCPECSSPLLNDVQQSEFIIKLNFAMRQKIPEVGVVIYGLFGFRNNSSAMEHG
jgi:hypothetical protein